MQEIRHDAEIRKTRLRNHLQLSSDRARSFSEGILNNISHLDEIYKRGEELVERSPDNEVITEFTRVTNQFKGDAYKVDLVQPFVMERAIFSKGNVFFFYISKFSNPFKLLPIAVREISSKVI